MKKNINNYVFFICDCKHTELDNDNDESMIIYDNADIFNDNDDNYIDDDIDVVDKLYSHSFVLCDN